MEVLKRYEGYGGGACRACSICRTAKRGKSYEKMLLKSGFKELGNKEGKTDGRLVEGSKSGDTEIVTGALVGVGSQQGIRLISMN